MKGYGMTKLDRAIAALEKANKLLQEVKAEQNAGVKWRGIQPASGVRGVTYEKRTGRWCARAWVNGRIKWIGTFDTIEQAKQAVDDAR
jgi:hypothetical protein